MKNKTKMKYLRDLATKTGSFIIILTETWLNEGILDAEVKIEGFRIYRQDRVGQTRGGVCIYLREDISAQISFSASNQSVETLMIKIKELKSLFFVNYRPGGVKGSGFETNLEDLSNVIELCQSNGQYPNINGFGDYNFPEQRLTTGVLPLIY